MSTILFTISSGISARAFLPGTVSRLTDAGHCVRVLCGAPDPTAALIGAEVTVSPGYLRAPSPRNDLRGLLHTWRMLHGVDVVHYSTPKAALLTSIASFVRRTPRRIYLVRGLRYESLTGLGRIAQIACEALNCAAATHVVAVSEGVRAELDRARWCRRKPVVLGRGGSTGVDTDHYRPATDRDLARQALQGRLGLDRDARIVLFVGRICRDKGIVELLKAWKSVNVPNAHLVLVGDNDDDFDLESSARTHHITWETEMLPYYQGAELLVLPTYREGLPNVVLEASACGLPVVATTATGLTDVVIDGTTGILVPVQSVSELSDAITDVLVDEERAHQLGKAGMEFVSEFFERSRVVEMHSDFISGATGRVPSGTH
jgi:glycosyltransferase involved in cell wall biosynthesis